MTIRPIPTLALLGLSLTACNDDDEPTLVGTWDATVVEGASFPRSGDSYYYGRFTESVDLVIGDDDRGTYGFHVRYEDDASYNEDDSFPVTVEHGSGSMVTLSIPDAGLTLTCTLGATLDCTDPEAGAYKFKRR